MEINENWKSRWLRSQMPQRSNNEAKFSNAPQEQSAPFAAETNPFKLMIRLSSSSFLHREVFSVEKFAMSIYQRAFSGDILPHPLSMPSEGM